LLIINEILYPSGKMVDRLRRESSNTAAGVHLPEGHYHIIPLFQHSRIPIA